MNLKKWYKQLRKETDLKKNDIRYVQEKIPGYHSKVVEMIDMYIEKRDNVMNLYEKEYKKILDLYIEGKKEVDVFSVLKSKNDRELYLKNENEKISEINAKINIIDRRLKLCDNIIKYLSSLQFNIKAIIDYEKYRGGVS